MGGTSVGNTGIYNSFDFQEMSRYNENIGRIVPQLEDQTVNVVSCSTESMKPTVCVENIASIDDKVMEDVMEYIDGFL